MRLPEVVQALSADSPDAGAILITCLVMLRNSSAKQDELLSDFALWEQAHGQPTVAKLQEWAERHPRRDEDLYLAAVAAGNAEPEL